MALIWFLTWADYTAFVIITTLITILCLCTLRVVDVQARMRITPCDKVDRLAMQHR